MSLDNVLAVAGAAMDHPTVLIIGLALSIALMGFRRQSFIARLLHQYRWIAYVGLIIILYVAIEMTLKGAYGQWPEALSFLSGWFGPPGAMGH
jgi:predicted tellurium resistance membrane protein TerC